jgi:hypothetical protein
VLLLSIAWKMPIPFADKKNPKDPLVDFLKRNHFDVSATEQTLNNAPIIRAKAALCQLQIARLAPDGSDRDLFRHLATGTDRAFVVFRGKVYRQQPIFWTVLDDLWYRNLRELGLSTRITSVIAIAANSSCDAERLPWDELNESS